MWTGRERSTWRPRCGAEPGGSDSRCRARGAVLVKSGPFGQEEGIGVSILELIKVYLRACCRGDTMLGNETGMVASCGKCSVA